MRDGGSLGAPGFRGRIIWNTYRRSWLFVLLMTGAVMSRRLAGAPFNAVDWIGVSLLGAFLCLPLLIGLLCPAPKDALVSIEADMSKAKWRDVFRSLDLIERSLRSDAPSMLRFDVRQHKACAMARHEGVNSGLKLLRPLETTVDQATYIVGMGRVNAAVNQHETALGCAERAIESAPDFAAAWILLAESQMALGEFAEAGAALERVESMPMTNEDNVMRMALHGAVMIDEGRADEMLEVLELASLTAHEVAERHVGGFALAPLVRGVQAWAFAEVGERERAVAMLEETQPFLEVYGDGWLLVRTQAAMEAVHGTV